MKINYYRNLILNLCKKEKNVTELRKLTNLSFGTLSYHLKILRDLNLISFRKESNKIGKPTYYKTIWKTKEHIKIEKNIYKNIKENIIEKKDFK